MVVGSLLIWLLRPGDRVKGACLAQLPNAISVIRSVPGGPAWRQTAFSPVRAYCPRVVSGRVTDLPLAQQLRPGMVAELGPERRKVSVQKRLDCKESARG